MAEKIRAERRRGKREIRLSTFPKLVRSKWPSWSSQARNGPFSWPAGKQQK